MSPDPSSPGYFHTIDISRIFSGISVGSLGQYPEYYDIVENVTAMWVPSIPPRHIRLLTHTSSDIKMSKAQNGARIKAWAGPDVGSGIVRNITFQNFVESEVDNPVVIDQVSFRPRILFFLSS